MEVSVLSYAHGLCLFGVNSETHFLCQAIVRREMLKRGGIVTKYSYVASILGFPYIAG